MCNSSGIENEHEILSCAQLEAQQELSKVVDASAPRATLTDIKVIKRDNIVLGISDLKQKKVDVKATIGGSKSVARVVIVEEANNKKEIEDSGEQITINPINTIKVNNCEIVSHRPRSVTAAIFAHPIIFSPNTDSQLDKNPITASPKIPDKSRAQSATAKIFRQSPQSVTSVTSTIFAPRTKDMNKGFLMFSEDEPGLTSKYRQKSNRNLPKKERNKNLYLCNWQPRVNIAHIAKRSTSRIRALLAQVLIARDFSHITRAALNHLNQFRLERENIQRASFIKNRPMVVSHFCDRLLSSQYYFLTNLNESQLAMGWAAKLKSTASVFAEKIFYGC